MSMNLVAQNSNPGSIFVARSELDEFLFAPVIEDANGMTLTVLSMLARSGVDPRSEAAELARLPVAKATDALMAYIGKMPKGLDPNCDTETIAARLAALLPGRANSPGTPGQTVVGSISLTQTHAVAIAAILICFVIGTIWATASLQSLAPGGGTSPAASAAAAAAAAASPHDVK